MPQRYLCYFVKHLLRKQGVTLFAFHDGLKSYYRWRIKYHGIHHSRDEKYLLEIYKPGFVYDYIFDNCKHIKDEKRIKAQNILGEQK